VTTQEEALKIVTDRKRAYQVVFGESPASLAVLDDLTVFCRGREVCLVPGDRDRTYALLGRNEVYHRVRHHLDLTPEQLVEIYFRPAKGAHGHDNDQTDPA
jgi:hypothetical protein